MKSILKNNKGQIGQLGPSILILVLSAAILVFGLVMIQEMRDTDIVRQDALNSTGDLVGGGIWSNTNDTLDGMASFADFWEIIVLAIVITIVIGLLLVVFSGRGQR